MEERLREVEIEGAEAMRIAKASSSDSGSGGTREELKACKVTSTLAYYAFAPRCPILTSATCRFQAELKQAKKQLAKKDRVGTLPAPKGSFGANIASAATRSCSILHRRSRVG
eukprot:3335599-Rhodomonas_salina.3